MNLYQLVLAIVAMFCIVALSYMEDSISDTKELNYTREILAQTQTELDECKGVIE